MKILTFLLAILSPMLLHSAVTQAQAVDVKQITSFNGLSSAPGRNFRMAKYGRDGSLYILSNALDGVRVLKVDGSGIILLAEAHTGAAGDEAIAMALDGQGNVYVVGTSQSGKLSGTPGSVFPGATGGSTNSFLAKFDTNLHPVFLTFLGADETAATGVAATNDAVFVAGFTYSAAFPTTLKAIQQTPLPGSSQNGFVQRFSLDGSAMEYATYLSGAEGDTVPSTIVADDNGNSYITGSTTASRYPTVAALQSSFLTSSAGRSSGFLTKLGPDGSRFLFSTYIAGTGITGLALDADSESLVLVGNVAIGQFPVTAVSMPLTATTYQTILRISLDGQTLDSSRVLVPGTQSFVGLDGRGGAWISGSLTIPLFPSSAIPSFAAGDAFLVHEDADGDLDQTFRFGGEHAETSLTSHFGPPASYEKRVAVAATLAADTTPSHKILGPFGNQAEALDPCSMSSRCAEPNGFLAIADNTDSSSSLSLSTDKLPNLTLRNHSSITAEGLKMSSIGFSVASNCGSRLQGYGECAIALMGAGPGSITLQASNAAGVDLAIPSMLSAPATIVVTGSEFDFGIVTAQDPPQTRTLVVSNLSSTTQTFRSFQSGATSNELYTLVEAATTCLSVGVAALYSVPANSSCNISIALLPAEKTTLDGPVRAVWKIGNHPILLTGFIQHAALNLSSSEIDFGVQVFRDAPYLPRYLYISNNSTSAAPHTRASLPPSSNFTVTDSCPTLMAPRTVCRLTLTYASPIAPSSDTATVAVDGQDVTLVATTVPASTPSNTTNPSISVSTNAINFTTPTIVTQVSSSPQLLTVMNAGNVALPIAFALSGDFTAVSDCPVSLPAGASCALQVTFVPSQPGAREGVLSFTSVSGFTPTYVSLTGSGLPILPSNSGTLAVGTTLLGEPIVAWYKVQQPLSSLSAATNNSLFGVALVADTGSGHGSLPASAFHASVTANCNNCWLGVQFLSQSAGASSASLTLATDPAGSPYVLFLTGTALPVEGLLLTPAGWDFGSLAVGSSSAPATFSLSNLLSSSANVTVQSVTTSGDFTIIPTDNGGLACGGTLVSTASCSIELAFAPTAVGQRNGALTVVATDATLTIPLTGVGVQSSGLGISPVSLDFQNVPGLDATQQSVSLSNLGSSTLTIGAVTSTSPNFSVKSDCSMLIAGARCSLTVTFIPGATPIAAALTIPVTSTANAQTSTTTFTVQLAGRYTVQQAGLEIVENMLNFGSTAAGQIGTTRQFTLNNLMNKALNITLDLPREFPLAIPGQCVTLPAGGTCTFSVISVPITGGPLTGTITATGTPMDGSAAVQAMAYVLGYGAATKSLTINGILIPNSPLDFGQVTSGAGSQQILTLTNSGTDILTIRRVTSEPPFQSTTTCGTPLPPSAGCSVKLTYMPIYEALASAGATPRNDNGLLVIESDAASSPDLLSLVGRALPTVTADPTTSAVLSALGLSQGALTFENTQVGNVSATQTLTATNTGTTTLHISSWMVSPDFTITSSCGTLLPGSACNFNVNFTPTAASNSPIRSGAFEILSDAGTSLDFVTLLGFSTPATLTLAPTALDFGTVNIGASDSLTVTVSNISQAPVTFENLTTTGSYTVTHGTCPADGGSLPVGAACSLTVRFAPSVIGTQIGTLSLASNASQLPLTVSLTGIAVTGHLIVTPGALAFGNVDQGFPSLLRLTLLNAGNATLTGIGNTVSGLNAADFAVTAPCSVTALAPNQGCTETVTFTPGATGARAATLNVASSDPAGPIAVALSGFGIEAGTFTLTVNGGSAASETVRSGSPAMYALVLTPKNGFLGQVALTCAPITAAAYASCSLLPSTLVLGSTAQTSLATVNTITSEIGSTIAILSGLLIFPFANRKKANRRKRLRGLLFSVSFVFGLTLMNGCGGGTPATSNERLTPPGTYKYLVTANSTEGAPVSSSVTLTLIVD